MEQKKRGRPRRHRPPRGEPLPCVDCGSPSEYYTDPYGIVLGQWRCRSCHELACVRTARNDYKIRYGDR